jgi:hypothetical protein
MPPFPATSVEFINILAHFHRAEKSRMAGWRDRIDRTTNWANLRSPLAFHDWNRPPGRERRTRKYFAYEHDLPIALS